MCSWNRGQNRGQLSRQTEDEASAGLASLVEMGRVELCSILENGCNPRKGISIKPLSISSQKKQAAITRNYRKHLIAVAIAVESKEKASKIMEAYAEIVVGCHAAAGGTDGESEHPDIKA